MGEHRLLVGEPPGVEGVDLHNVGTVLRILEPFVARSAGVTMRTSRSAPGRTYPSSATEPWMSAPTMGRPSSIQRSTTALAASRWSPPAETSRDVTGYLPDSDRIVHFVE